MQLRPNGSGKSTLSKVLAVIPTTRFGRTAKLDDQDFWGWNPTKFPDSDFFGLSIPHRSTGGQHSNFLLNPQGRLPDGESGEPLNTINLCMRRWMHWAWIGNSLLAPSTKDFPAGKEKMRDIANVHSEPEVLHS